MKRLGAYISPREDTASSSPYFTKGCFVYYEYVSDDHHNILPHIRIWRFNVNFNQQPDEVIFLKSPSELKEHIAPCETWPNHYISHNDRTYRIRDMKCRFTRFPDIEVIDELTVDAVDHYETWKLEDSSAYRFLKEAKLVDCELKTNIDYTRKRPIAAANDLVMPVTIKEELKKSLEQDAIKSALNSCWGGFTTNPDPFKVVKIAEKETKTMTVTDAFLKNLNGITITSTYAKLDHGIGNPYYIYYPEMEITDDIADTLLAVLIMVKKDFNHKVVFNPEKGTTTIYRNNVEPITVKCKDCEFDYIIGYEMARSKMYIGADDYNWFNKIKNHRKTHIEYTEKKPTEPKAKRTSKKGGKK